jgi:hypothetical protein
VEPLAAAAEALDSAEDALEGLPMTPEVAALHCRFLSARTVLHDVIVERTPSVTGARRAGVALLERASRRFG